MCCFIYQHKGIENSPYAHFVSNDSWQKLEDQFTKVKLHLLEMFDSIQYMNLFKTFSKLANYKIYGVIFKLFHCEG